MRLPILALFTLLAAGPALADESTTGAIELGPKVGEPAPDFTLESEEGRRVTVGGYHGKKKVIVAFYGGAQHSEGVPQLAELRAVIDDPAGEDVQVLAVSADPHAVSRALLRRLAPEPSSLDAMRGARRAPRPFRLGFPFLEDPDGTAAGRYGLPGSKELGTFLVDEAGIVRWKTVGDRATGEAILAALKSLSQ